MQNRIPQCDGCVAGTLRRNCERFLDGQGLARGAQDPFAQTDEGNDQEYLGRRHGGLHDLNTQADSNETPDAMAAQRRLGHAENGYVADHHPDCHAKRQPVRRDALTQQGEQRLEYPVVQPGFHEFAKLSGSLVNIGMARAASSRYSRFKGE